MMNRIIWHHTGGGYRPNPVDLRAYHRLIDGDGLAVAGQFEIEANAPGQITSGAHAAHTLNLNTGSVGLAVCCMVGGVWGAPGDSRAFPKPVQIDGLIRETARLCLQYRIEPDRRFTLSHAEVPITLGVAQRQKWDFDYDPRARHDGRDPVAIGDELRQELRAVLRDMGGIPAPAPAATPNRPVLRQGSTGDEVRVLQALLGLTTDGQFGPRTHAAVVAFQRRNGLLPDGVVGRMTWAALARKP